MEVVLDKLSFFNGKYISYVFDSGTITGICGDNRRDIGESIVEGQDGVYFGFETINIGYVPLKKSIDTSISVREELLNTIILNDQKFDDKLVEELFEILKIDLNILDKSIRELSLVEQKGVLLASALLGDNQLIVLDTVEKNLNNRCRINLKKYIKQLANKKNKTIIVISEDVLFMQDLVDNYIVIDNGELVLSGSKREFYNPKLYNYISKPPIIEFTNYINENGHKIRNYLETKELLKAIYRDIENKR